MLQQELVISSINSFKLSICRLYTGGSFPNLEGPKARITENTEKSKGVKSGEQIILKSVTIIYAAFMIIREELLYSCYFVWMYMRVLFNNLMTCTARYTSLKRQSGKACSRILF
jgi:hypothetical protein